MNWFRQTNSWHWLLMSMAVCLAIASYGCLTVWRKAAVKNGPILQGMQTHADQLVLLVEEDALLIEHQVAEIQKRTTDYEAAARAKVGSPIPQGESSVLHLSNEINRALQKHDLRVVEQEKMEAPPETQAPAAASRLATGTPPELARAAAAQVAVARQAKETKQSLPFSTREIRFVVEGDYRDMFMFLVRQSHLKPSYHFKGIRVFPSPGQFGMRMEFTAQIHFT